MSVRLPLNMRVMGLFGKHVRIADTRKLPSPPSKSDKVVLRVSKVQKSIESNQTKMDSVDSISSMLLYVLTLAIL